MYRYKGISKTGSITQGRIESDSLSSAKKALKDQEIYVTAIHLDSSIWSSSLTPGKRVGVKVFAQATRNLSTLIGSGIPLLDSIQTVAKQTEHSQMKKILNQVATSVSEGNSFHQSLKNHSKVFDTTYIAMCEAGEASGTLDLVLLRLAEFTENQSKLQNKIRSALIYPILMAVFSFFMIVFLMIYVVPKVSIIFESNDQIQLPWYSQMMLNASTWMQQYWMSGGLILLFSTLILWRMIKSPTGHRLWSRFSLQLPIIGNIMRSSSISRLSRTLSTLLHGGVPMIESLNIAENVVSNSVIKNVISESKAFVQKGDNLSTPFVQSGEFPAMVTQMIRVGEKTGQLEPMLKQISDTYDNQIRSDIDALTSLLEPAMLIVMGGVIAFIVFSTIIPLMQMYNTTTI